MREETAEWLTPLMDEAKEQGVDLSPLMDASMMPAAEAASPEMDALASMMPEGAVHQALDWIRFGRLLRHELGWDETYPGNPTSRE